MQLLWTIQGKAHQEMVPGKKLRPLAVHQKPVCLDGVVDPQTLMITLFLKGYSLLKKRKVQPVWVHRLEIRWNTFRRRHPELCE